MCSYSNTARELTRLTLMPGLERLQVQNPNLNLKLTRWFLIEHLFYRSEH